MQAFAREFSAEDLFREKTWQPLRMLTKPFARYGKPDSRAIDGALFAYVLTTDPEVYLMIEGPGRQGRPGVAICLRAHDNLLRPGVVEGPARLGTSHPLGCRLAAGGVILLPRTCADG